MKILILKTGEEAIFPDEYAGRLIEQGKAILPPAAGKPEADAGAEQEDESNRSATGASALGSGSAVTEGTVPQFRSPEETEAETPAANTGKGKKTGGKR